MPIDTQRVWLTEDTYDRARIELAMLRMERATGSHRGHIDPEQRAVRIRQLQELIAAPPSDMGRPDDGVAEPGMVLTVRYEAEI
jgi:transcription elongation factor GreA